MTDLTALATDTKAELEGVWTPWRMGVELLIASLNNTEFEAYMTKLLQPYMLVTSGTPDVPDDVQENFMKEAIAHTVLRDWRNIEEDGEPLAYTPAIGLKMLQDPGYRELYKFLVSNAQMLEKYSVVRVQAAAKN